MSENLGKMADEVFSANAVADGEIYGSAARIRGLYVRSTATEGTIVLKDGGAGGTVVLTINTPATEEGFNVSIPGAGISCATDIYADLTTDDGVTVFYSKGP